MVGVGSIGVNRCLGFGTGKETIMHIRRISREAPQQAANIEQIFDVIIQFVNVLTALEGLLGFDIAEIVQMFKEQQMGPETR